VFWQVGRHGHARLDPLRDHDDVCVGGFVARWWRWIVQAGMINFFKYQVWWWWLSCEHPNRYYRDTWLADRLKKLGGFAAP
jgi:hypothetical protein